MTTTQLKDVSPSEDFTTFLGVDAALIELYSPEGSPPDLVLEGARNESAELEAACREASTAYEVARDAADAYFCLPAAVKASHHDHDGDGPSLVGGVGYHVDFDDMAI